MEHVAVSCSLLSPAEPGDAAVLQSCACRLQWHLAHWGPEHSAQQGTTETWALHCLEAFLGQPAQHMKTKKI